MKHVLAILTLCGLLLVSGGCATTAGYFANRGRDAADVFTITVGVGAGIKARVGPIAPAMIINHDLAGLRAGTFFLGNGNPMESDVAAPFPIALHSWDDRVSFGHDVFMLESFRQESERPQDSIVVRRGKDVLIKNPFPCVAVGKYASDYTQIELALGLGPTLRIGVNIGEFLDFLLGWFGVDLFKDDVGLIDETEGK